MTENRPRNSTQEKRRPRFIIPLLHHTFRLYMWYIVFLGLLGFLSSLIAGFGASIVVPLLSFLVGGGGQQTNSVTTLIVRAFDYLPFRYSFRSLLIAIVLLFSFRGVLLYWFAHIRARIRTDFRDYTMRSLFANLLNARWPYLLKQKNAELQHNIIHDVDKGGAVLDSLSLILLSGLGAIVSVVFAFLISPRLTLLAILTGFLLMGAFRFLVQSIRSASERLSHSEKEVSQFTMEHLMGLKTIKTSAIASEVFARSKFLFNELCEFDLKRSDLRSFNNVFAEPVSVIFVAIAFGFLYRSPSFEFGAFIAAMFLVQRIFQYLNSLQSALHQLNEQVAHVQHVHDLQKELAENQESTPAEFSDFYEHRDMESKIGLRRKASWFGRAISFKDVSFSYIPGHEVLSHVSFSIAHGEMVGLIGPSGSGKTSIADLLTRLYVPGKGEILIDDKPIDTYDLFEWRHAIGYVSQDIFVLNDTIENNIRFYDQTVSHKGMAEAAKKANIHDFIESLPQKFSTIVGDRGVMLSGGQRQRVVLARVLARRPDLLILDEATSALDNESELAIQGAIRSLRGEITVFIIAHRLSTVVDANRILVLDKGKVTEEGTPEQLLKNKKSYFYRMYHLKEMN